MHIKSPYIQTLRGIAFLLIFLSHFFVTVAWWGAFGVSIFIVLSGYLEAKWHLNNNLAVKAFVAKKVKRFYPLHLITLLIAIPISLLGISTLSQAIKLLVKIGLHLTLLQSWIPLGSVYFSLNAVAWYLPLVDFFALLTPGLMKWFRKSSTVIVGITTSLLILFDFIIGNISMKLPASHWIAYVCPLTRSADFIIGGYICST